jgi:hypothetical protein
MPKKLGIRNAWPSMGNRSRKSRQGKGSSKGSDYRQKIRANKKVGKNGCTPKLFMFLLPFMAMGTYLFIRS